MCIPPMNGVHLVAYDQDGRHHVKRHREIHLSFTWCMLFRTWSIVHLFEAVVS